HILIPAIDEHRPATLSKRVVTGMLRQDLRYDGVILSDDLEMQAVAKSYTVPDATILAIDAGCDGVLICGDNHEVQAAALEAVIHAAEDGRIRLTQVADALKRQQRAKERFLAMPVA